MNDYTLDIRNGNILEYYGPTKRYSNVRVLNIVTNNYEEQLYTLLNPYDEGSIISAHPEQLRPILLTSKHLMTLGFKFSQASKRYSNGQIIISSFGYPKMKDLKHITWIDLGFRVLPVDFPISPSLGEIENGTNEMYYVHMFQNYCADNGIKDLKFDLIK